MLSRALTALCCQSKLHATLGTVLSKTVLREVELANVVHTYFRERGQTFIGQALSKQTAAVRAVIRGLVDQRGGDEVLTVDTVREACAIVAQRSRGFSQDDIGNR